MPGTAHRSARPTPIGSSRDSRNRRGRISAFLVDPFPDAVLIHIQGVGRMADEIADQHAILSMRMDLAARIYAKDDPLGVLVDDDEGTFDSYFISHRAAPRSSV